VPVASGSETRDWWPLVAGSDDHALLLWQRFVDGEMYSTLMYSVVDPSTGDFIRDATQLAGEISYYTYDVQYIRSLKRFLVLAAGANGSGVAWLLDDEGNQTAALAGLPSPVREAQAAILDEHPSARVVYPQASGGVVLLDTSQDSIKLSQTINGERWGTAGTGGILIDSSHAYFVSLSPSGLQESTYVVGPKQ